MKTTKNTFLLALFLSTYFSSLNAQQMYWVHQDNVNPSMIMEYEKVAKEFQTACVEHNPKGQWTAISMDDFRFCYVSPIDNFAALDERPFADMAKAMGDKFGEMFNSFDQCYDWHGDYIVVHDEALSYMPEGSTEAEKGHNYRDYYFIYFTPQNAKKIKEGLKAVKEMFASKGSKNYYRIYKSGFGNSSNYYLVAMSSKDAIDSATKQKTNEEVLGPDRFETFNKVMKYASRMEEVTGQIRTDLSYSPK